MLVRIAPGQQISWAKNTAFTKTRGLIADALGSVYHFGSKTEAYYSNVVDTTGSFLQKYSSNGSLLFSKKWPGTFWIKNLIYDGAQYFYFAGSFSGNHIINGITISSNGNEDGMIGKMNNNGQVLWISTFGASGLDAGNDLTFNKNKTKLVLTGSLTDSLFVNKNYIAVNAQKTLLLAGFNLSGNLMDHKMIDFLIERNYGNKGLEIKTDSTGNYILAAWREGKFWNNDTLNAPEEGVYIYKLNPSYAITWSKFIISGACYYGYSYGGLSVSENGDAYYPSFCSGKYGGNGVIRRLSSSTGIANWTGTNTDGAYAETFCNNQNLYLIGTEGANGCPCQSNQAGYQVIKKLDKNNVIIGETRLTNVALTHITKSSAGVIFISGYIYGAPYAVIGSDTVYVTNYGNAASGSFIMALNDVPCTPPLINGEQIPWLTKYLCPATSFLLDAGSGYSSYLWSNGKTTQSISVDQTGVYRVKVTQPSGCIAYSLPTKIESKICMKPTFVSASYNNVNGKNKLILFNNEYGISKFNVYKGLDKSNLTPLASFTPTNTWDGIFSDSLAIEDTSAVYYKVTAVDTCGTESEVSTYHKTIFLTQSGSNNQQLNWNKYEGFINSYNKHYILRGTSAASLTLYDSTSLSHTSYNITLSAQKYFYQIKVQLSPNNQYYTSYSNIVSPVVTGIKTAGSSSTFKLDVFPNPSNGLITFNIDGPKEIGTLYLRIKSVVGEQLDTQVLQIKSKTYKGTIDLSNYAKGIYFIEITINKKTEVKRIVLE